MPPTTKSPIAYNAAAAANLALKMAIMAQSPIKGKADATRPVSIVAMAVGLGFATLTAIIPIVFIVMG